MLAGNVAQRDAQVAVLAATDDGHVAHDRKAAPLPVRPKHDENNLHVRDAFPRRCVTSRDLTRRALGASVVAAWRSCTATLILRRCPRADRSNCAPASARADYEPLL